MIAGLKTLFTGKNFMRSLLAIGWSAFSMFYLTMISFKAVPEGNVRIADTILGFLLGTAISGILMFYYGSTQGSSEKDNLIATMQPAPSSSSSVTVTKAETKPEDLTNAP